LLKMSEVRPINMPKFDELSVKKVYPMICRDNELMRYFPDSYPKGREPDRQYVFNILNSLRGEYVARIIKNAHE
jgi:hypothetical protein